MATIISQPASFSLSSQLDDVVIATSAEKCRVEVLLACNAESHTLLDETLYPNNSGNIVVSDLTTLADYYLRLYLEGTLTVRAADLDAEGNADGNAASASISLLYCAADTGTTAEYFTQHHFLTILNGMKDTSLGREERVYAYGVSKVTVSAMIDSGSSFDTVEAELNAAAFTGNIYTFFVSPDNIMELLALTTQRLVSYSVKADSRVQQFRVVDNAPNPAPSFAFINSFGCMEFVYCFGRHLKDSKYSRSMARIKGMRRNYLIEEDRQFVAHTGVLNQWMADWADDLLRSREVYLWVDGKVGREVVITDSKSEIDNLDDAMPDFEITYGYAQRNHNVLQIQHAGRIFDNTFDHTFE